MSDYCVYVISGDDHIVNRIDFECADDSAAIESAKQYIDGKDIELWQRDRRIARFDAGAKDAMRSTGELRPPK